MHVWTVIARRVLLSAVVLLLVSLVTFSLMHADMNGQDFVRRPSGHAWSDENSASADVVAGGGQRLDGGADSVLRQAMSGGNAAVDTLLRSGGREAFGGMVRGEVAFGKQAEFGACKDLHLG